MSVVGRRVSITDASDSTKVGRRGEIVMETSKTLLIRTSDGTITVEKAGTVLQTEGNGELLAGDDLRGRLEDRIREGRR